MPVLLGVRPGVDEHRDAAQLVVVLAGPDVDAGPRHGLGDLVPLLLADVGRGAPGTGRASGTAEDASEIADQAGDVDARPHVRHGLAVELLVADDMRVLHPRARIDAERRQAAAGVVLAGAPAEVGEGAVAQRVGVLGELHPALAAGRDRADLHLAVLGLEAEVEVELRRLAGAHALERPVDRDAQRRGQPGQPGGVDVDDEVELAALHALAPAEGLAQQLGDLRGVVVVPAAAGGEEAPEREQQSEDQERSAGHAGGGCKATCAWHGRGTVASERCSRGRLSPWSWRSCGRCPAPPGRRPERRCSSWMAVAACTPSATRSCPRPTRRRRPRRAPPRRRRTCPRRRPPLAARRACRPS